MRICPLCGTTTHVRICPVCGTPTVLDTQEFISDEEEPAGVIDHYMLIKELGEGGMGKVFLAKDIRKSRKVALKLINPRKINDPHAVTRARRGVLACASLNHPNIVEVYDFKVLENGEWLIAMRYINGTPLDQLIRKHGRFKPSAVMYLLEKLADALNYAHNKGVVHRDIKPSNIILERDSSGRIQPVITDFEVAKWFGSIDNQTDPTQKGFLIGTPSYMSPEQIMSSGEVDGRSDIYSLGVVTYEMLTGINPFRRPDTIDTIKAQLHIAPPPLPEEVKRELPPPFVMLLFRMLAKDRDRRIQSGKSIVKALKAMSSMV